MLSLAAGEVIEGQSAFDRVLELLSEKIAVFHVYRCSKINTDTEADNVLSFPEITQTPIAKFSQKVTNDEPKLLAQRQVIQASEPSKKEIVEIADLVSETNVESVDIAKALPEPKILLAEPLEEVAVSEEKIQELTPIDEDKDYQILVGIMTEIIQIVERVSLLVSKEANFTTAFRAGLLEVTQEYPVFDPFAEDFSYQDGKIRLTSLIPKEVLINGLTKVLKYTLDELVRMSPTSQLRERIAGALLRLEQLKQSEFEFFSISSALAEIITID
ncbi:MAG: hypothetical protein FD167_2571 [bacterium]|nr:MAG: hypothetical protein FD167_2571 [bacterium]